MESPNQFYPLRISRCSLLCKNQCTIQENYLRIVVAFLALRKRQCCVRRTFGKMMLSVFVVAFLCRRFFFSFRFWTESVNGIFMNLFVTEYFVYTIGHPRLLSRDCVRDIVLVKVLPYFHRIEDIRSYVGCAIISSKITYKEVSRRIARSLSRPFFNASLSYKT